MPSNFNRIWKCKDCGKFSLQREGHTDMKSKGWDETCTANAEEVPIASMTDAEKNALVSDLMHHGEEAFWKLHKHCDDYIDDESAPECLRKFLEHNRASATEQYKREDQPGFKKPVLFAKKADGTQVRVVMASRMGDVGITTNLKAERGYGERVLVEDLTDFTDDLTQPQQE